MFRLKPLGKEELDHCFVLDTNNVHDIEMLYPKLGKRLQLSFGSESDQQRFLQVYTPKDRQSIAIEPMTCAPNAFHNSMGLLQLEPGRSYSWCSSRLLDCSTEACRFISIGHLIEPYISAEQGGMN